MRLLVTRPEPDAQRTAAALRALGHEAVMMPMLRIETIANADIGVGPWDALVVTSANAVRAVAAHRRLSELLVLPVFVVGRRTGEAARAAGFATMVSSDGDATALAQLAIKQLSTTGARLLYLAGEDRTGEIETALGAHGFAVHTVVMYRAVASDALAPAVTSALVAGEIDGILHFSRRSAEVFTAAATTAGVIDNVRKLQHYCLSAQVATVLEGAACRGICVAAQPDEQMLLACIR